MVIEDSMCAGDPVEALAALQEKVRKDPANAEHRIFLFQLLSVLGQWDRALTQLGVAGELDAGALAMVQAYREALQCEAYRSGVFSARHSPLVFGEPEQWVALMLQALGATAEGQYGRAKELRDQAFADAPEVSGTIDGEPFAWIADADSRLGPLLEVIVNGRYYWVPFHRIREIRIEEPADLRDLVWMPGNFIWSNGGGSVGLIPTRYPGSEESDDGRIRLARLTEWVDVGEETFLGLGQRMLTTDIGDHPLMDVRHVFLDTGEEGGGPADA